MKLLTHIRLINWHLFENTTECVTLGSASPIFVPGFVFGSAGPYTSRSIRASTIAPGV